MDDTMNDAVIMPVRLITYRFRAIAIHDTVLPSIGSVILRRIRSKYIDELPISAAWITINNWSDSITSCMSPLIGAANIEATTNIANAEKGIKKKILRELRTPKREIEAKEIRMPDISKFSCDRAIHRLMINTRIEDTAFKTRTRVLNVWFACTIV